MRFRPPILLAACGARISGAMVSSLAMASAALAQAEPSFDQRVDAVFDIYAQGCDWLIRDAQGFLDALPNLQDAPAYLVETTEGAGSIQGHVVWPSMTFSFDAGYVGRQTFMSCGSYLTLPSDGISDATAVVNAALEQRATAVTMGNTDPTILEFQDGMGVTETISEGTTMYGSGVLSEVDTVTFAYLLDSYGTIYLSIYIHHVFEGRVGLPNAETTLRYVP